MARNRLLAILACVVGVLVLAYLAYQAGALGGGPRSGPRASAPGEGRALIGGPFQMVDQSGAPVSEAVLKGRWSAVFFGFTFCPDVCPGTLQALTAARAQLGPKADALRIVFISVDPDRDTPAQLKGFLSGGGAPASTIALTGSPAQADAAARAYRVYHRKVGEGATYSVDHSTAIYLMDPQGGFNRVIAYHSPPEEIARQIKAAMAGR